MKIIVKVLIYALFQFHKGTIKTKRPGWDGATCPHFNSIKVRLKLGLRQNIADKVALFQFHKGTIKTDAFNTSTADRKTDFNSIKVRLKQKEELFSSCPDEFQFHKGTIKTDNSCLARTFHRNFNSIKVRLKRPFSSAHVYFTNISIP